MQKTTISIGGLLSRFKGKVSFTFFLVLFEAILDLLYPLFIGFAINDLLEKSYSGIYALAGLGILGLLIGSGRRFYDTRAYTSIYITLSEEMVLRERENKSSISKISARSSLLTEFVEFLENSVPTIVSSVIGVVGILIVVATLSIPVFWACTLLFLLMVLIYVFSGNKNFIYNKGYNNEIENMVNALSAEGTEAMRAHYKSLIGWNIKLSDLETWNYAALWTGIIGLLVYAPIAVINSGTTNYGAIFSILMYVFQFVEGLVSLPLFIQQIIRLQEISNCFKNA
ncbi:MAG: hypothetical protein HN390_00455 [Anaerolineae bacterium]|jgi:hypothetical protein|nr:hypothetical protein [Anaerolineae bacterium]MBT7192241.1 hypothetical protein [Anaerolineae bacterium]